MVGFDHGTLLGQHVHRTARRTLQHFLASVLDVIFAAFDFAQDRLKPPKNDAYSGFSSLIGSRFGWNVFGQPSELLSCSTGLGLSGTTMYPAANAATTLAIGNRRT